MNDQAPPPPDVPAGWYQDPDQPHTQRYWDGEQWTEQRAPQPVQSPSGAYGWLDEDGKLTFKGNFALGLIVAGIGAAIAIVGVFLPLADTESSLHIAKNSLIQHWEGGVAIGLALLGFLVALRPSLRWITFFAGAGLIGLAILAGTDLPIEYRNRFSEAVAGEASAGAGVWTVGVGGVVMAISAYFTDWQTAGEGTRSESRRHTWQEIMTGERQIEAADSDDDHTGVDMSTRQEPPVRRRRATWREIMSGERDEPPAGSED